MYDGCMHYGRILPTHNHVVPAWIKSNLIFHGFQQPYIRFGDKNLEAVNVRDIDSRTHSSDGHITENILANIDGKFYKAVFSEDARGSKGIISGYAYVSMSRVGTGVGDIVKSAPLIWQKLQRSDSGLTRSIPLP